MKNNPLSLKVASLEVLSSVYELSKQNRTLFYNGSSIEMEMPSRYNQDKIYGAMTAQDAEMLLDTWVDNGLVEKVTISNHPDLTETRSKHHGYRANFSREEEIKLILESSETTR